MHFFPPESLIIQNDPNFLNIIITGHETLLHYFDFRTKSAISVWEHIDSPPLKDIQQIKTVSKVIMMIFFYHESVIDQHTVPTKATVNG